MKDTTFRICNAAIGRIFIKLIETAEGADWDFAQLGRTITALKGVMTNADYATDLDLDRTIYHTFCEHVNISETRSQRARERWQHKKAVTAQTADIPVIIPAEKAVEPIIVPAEPVRIADEPVVSPVEKEPAIPETEETASETEENNVGPGHIVPSGLTWSETIAVVNGRVELPRKRPICYADVPPHLRAIGVESHEEYLRHKLYDEGVRGYALESKVSLHLRQLIISRRKEEVIDGNVENC
ncbi:MAG: hypothetical protein K2K77_01215 [Duncaniella sp.]|nr:hypothetical protein [Duncaniella sp.]